MRRTDRRFAPDCRDAGTRRCSVGRTGKSPPARCIASSDFIAFASLPVAAAVPGCKSYLILVDASTKTIVGEKLFI